MAKLGFFIHKVDVEHATGVARQWDCIKGARVRVLSCLESFARARVLTRAHGIINSVRLMNQNLTTIAWLN